MTKDNFNWAVGGEAGFGINASGLIFSKTLTRSGFNIFNYIEYPSLIRGGHNVFSVRASDKEVFSQEKGIDILVALNRETFDLHKEDLKASSFVIYDANQFKIGEREIAKGITFLQVPLEALVKKVGGIKLMTNNVALGASIALLGLDLKPLFSVIEDNFLRKGKEIVDKNQKAAQAGYDFVKQNHRSLIAQTIKPKDKQEASLVLTGNEAISLGVVLAGCQFFAAYPMTPATSILHNLAAFAEKTGMVVKHAEDEISVINMAIGASFAGVRSALATSGGGFALMQEAVSLAGITETPLVIIECQRTGPASGMPTWTEQADLQFILRSGHGDFPKIVLTPGDQEEAFYLTAQAFNLADVYQCPVFVVSDKYLSESHKSLQMSNVKCQMSNFKIDRGKLVNNITIKSRLKVEDPRHKMSGQYNNKTMKSYLRYKITDGGVSVRAIPGMKGCLFQANSYEHVEDGHTTEDIDERIKQVDKRTRKMKTFVKKHLPKPKVYGEKNAEITLVGWGSTKGPVLQAINNQRFNYLHLNYLWPFPKEEVAKVLRNAKKTLLLEGNSTAQLGQLIRQETGIEIKDQYLKYDGRPFYPEEIINFINNL